MSCAFRKLVSRKMDVLLLLCLLGIVTAEEGSAPVITEHPSSVVARRNNPATLNCAADDATRIRWFHDGEEVAVSQDSRSHRILLPSGSLFFFRVSTTRRDSDAGTYWCVASNQYGATRSRNATLIVATLANEFQTLPDPLVKTRVKDSLVLPCRPPRGTPPPILSWLRDGQAVTNSSRITVTEAGDLIINHVVQEDAATYVCHATNDAGTRESSPTKLIVMTPPWFEERPANMTAASGVIVELECRARGSPSPTITWRRLDGKMPLGRATIEDHRLVLDHVAAGDSGIYVCEGENEAGVAAAQATLTVIDAPELAQRPQDLQIVAGKTAQLTCRVAGDPKPSIFWRLPTHDRTALLTPSHTSDHASVSEDGQTLLLDDITIDDSGGYYCWGISSGGGVSTRAEVTVVEAYPPPVVGIGPQDLTVAPESVATFPCEAVSEAAAPTISWWYRPAVHLPARQLSDKIEDPRFTFPLNGALIVKDVRADDSGIYTCHITATTGTIEQAAVLRVTDDATEISPSQLPAPPSKPRLMFVNQTAVHLTWLPNSQMSGVSGQSYTVEYWRHGWDEWRVAEVFITQESCVVTQLDPDHTYTFLVRAVSQAGASFPSPWSDPITTRSPRDPSLSINQARHARRKLSRPVVTLTNAAIVTSVSVQLTWEFLLTTEESVEGVLVYTVSEDGSVQVATVLGAMSSSHLQHSLKPNTDYTFFVVPFWSSVEGTPSNSHSVKTPEDVPIVAPDDVGVRRHEDNSVLITWSTLTPEEARGDVIGYLVTLTHNGSQTTETVINPWLEARGLSSSSLYTVQVAALTGAGPGPFTPPVLIDVGPSDARRHQDVDDLDDKGSSILYAPPQPAWLVYLLIPLILLLFVATLVYVRRLRHKAPPSNPAHNPVLYQDPSLYPAHHSVNMYSEQKLWHPAESDKSSLSSKRYGGDQLLNEYAEPRVQWANETTEPYATTALLTAPESPHLPHSKPWRHHSDDSGVQVNWQAFLPPPPPCPPPNDIDLGDPSGGSDPHGICLGYGSGSQYDNMGRSEQYEKPCDATSDHTYDVYAQTTSIKGRDGYQTFNTLQGRGYHRPHRECQPQRPASGPRNNTH